MRSHGQRCHTKSTSIGMCDVSSLYSVQSDKARAQMVGRGHMTGNFRPRSNTHGFIALGPYLLVKFAVTRTHTNEFKTSCASRALHYFSSPQAKMPLQIGLKQMKPHWHITKACRSITNFQANIGALLSWASKQVCPWQYKDHASC